jgi:predicted molibdopterin-dependent oxidoreductase YjgC
MFLYGKRILEHPRRGDCVRALENLALLTGQVGAESCGVNALMPHNNSQGAMDMGLLPRLLRRYWKIPAIRSWHEYSIVLSW